MGQNSSIEWTDHTFNPRWGCVKVSPGCEHCYAESWAKRVGANVWGAKQDRRFFTDQHWREPLRWNSIARSQQERKRVFSASMADVFEARPDLDPWRRRLWSLIEQTPWLDWLLLTKRPQHILRLSPWQNSWPKNVWVGTSVEDQTRADERLSILLAVPARRRFLSCELLLGPVDLRAWLLDRPTRLNPFDWVIAGGESGPAARPLLPAWARRLRDQCSVSRTPFHFKQSGHWVPIQEPIPDEVQVRKFWDEVLDRDVLMAAQGKKGAGRLLDGETWDGRPAASRPRMSFSKSFQIEISEEQSTGLRLNSIATLQAICGIPVIYDFAYADYKN